MPTGAGKTFAALIPWLADPAAPRRLVYALPMRSLVEQTVETVRAALIRLGDLDTIPVHVLMGGVASSDWPNYPERRTVLIGTIDMLLSRALNRGYGENRFSWPVEFALLNNDCRWVFDEVQLMGPARTTSAQLAGLRHKLGVALPSETMWMSATVDHESLRTFDHIPRGDVVRLSDADRAGPLARRLNAVKTVSRVDLTGAKRTDLAKWIAEGRPREVDVAQRSAISSPRRARVERQAVHLRSRSMIPPRIVSDLLCVRLLSGRSPRHPGTRRRQRTSPRCGLARPPAPRRASSSASHGL